VKNSKEEVNFISDFIKGFNNIDISNISDKDTLKQIVQEYAKLSDSTWFKYSHLVNIIRWSKDWWNEDCQMKLTAYRPSKRVERWKDFKKIVKTTKQIFFNEKI